MPSRRIEHEAAFVLHSHPYSETSLLVEAFSRSHGRLPLVAKGARRQASSLRGVLLAFQPLVDIAQALNMTVAGVVAHQSALRDGELLKIPQYEI